MKKKFLKLFVLLLVFAISIPFLTNFLYGLILNYLPGKMYVNNSDTWINFLGGFLGAGLTLIGVFWQIEESKKEKKEELISNTYATYKLLESELTYLCATTISIDVICKNFSDMNGINNIDLTSFKKNIHETLKKTINEYSKQDTIYNYISQSLPEEKINLITLSNSLFTTFNCVHKIIENLEVTLDLESLSKSNDIYLSSIGNDLNTHKSNLLNFKKKYKMN